MLRRAAGLLLLLGLAPANAWGQGRAGITVTFLANEGVLLRGETATGSRAVLIDALMLPYRGYAVPSDSTQARLSGARPPFDAVDVILATHRHGDHFHPVPVGQHLRANSRASFVASRQVIDSLRSGAFGVYRNQLLPRTIARGTVQRLEINGVPVTLLGLPHGGADRHAGVEHLAFIVELGGRRVLHLGDGELSDAALAPLRLDTMRVDLALLPSWALASEEMVALVQRRMAPAAVAAIHLGGGDGSTRRAIARFAPTATVFVREGATLFVP